MLDGVESNRHDVVDWRTTIDCFEAYNREMVFQTNDQNVGTRVLGIRLPLTYNL